MPKVLSVFGVEPKRIGGTETFARELSLQLGERRWDSILCFEKSPPKEVLDFLRLPNVTLETVDQPSGSSWQGVSNLASVLRQYKPDILHLHFTGFLGIYPWLAKAFSVKKVFFTDHTSRPAGYAPQKAPFWKRGLVRIINFPITKITCVSNYGYECITALDVLPRERFVTIYNSVDLSRVHHDQQRAQDFRRRYNIPEDRSVILQVSWIIPEKGIPDLLKAAQLVLQDNPKAQFVFVGDGAYRDQYAKDAVTLGISEHVTWTGLVQDPFAEGVFDVADVVCQVSTWEEVFGWVIAEAMAYGKPIVATRVGGIPELVSDGESGYLVDRGDVVAMADRIKKLLQQPELRKQMGEAGIRKVNGEFDLKKNVARLIDCYDLLREDKSE